MDIATAATLGATAITLAWFIRDMKRENTKVLKQIEEGQRKGFETLENGQERQSRLISDGLNKLSDGLNKLSEDNKIIVEASRSIAQILERIDNKIKT